MSPKILIISLLAPLCVGCASITGTTGQSVSVQTTAPDGNELSGAKCDMSNSKGKWFVTTPGSVSITRSNDNLVVQCRKEPYEIGTGSIVSVTKGAMFGNIIFGGGIGALVDHNTGAAYEYPAFFTIAMGPSHGPAASVIDPSVPLAVSASTDSSPAFREIESLKRMLDAGIITRSEFEAKKTVVLQRM